MCSKQGFHLRGESLEDRRLLTASNVVEHDRVGYFASPTAGRLERYDLQAEAWLDPIALDSATSVVGAFAVDDHGIYANVGNSVYRYAVDGSDLTLLIDKKPNAIHTDGNLLFLNLTHGYDADFISLDSSTGQFIAEITKLVEPVYGSAISPQMNRILGRTDGLSPPDINYVSYRDDGTFIEVGDSPYHGYFPGATRTFVSPDGMRVVDDYGNYYAVGDLTHLGALAAQIKDIAFGTDSLYVLSGNTITAYGANNLPTGIVTLSTSPSNIFINDHNVITFTVNPLSPHGYDADLAAFTSFAPAQPGPTVNPVGLAYKPDKIEVTADGDFLILDINAKSIFRWDTETRAYTESIPLVYAPKYMAYSSENNVIYVAYKSGLIDQIDLNTDLRVETPFAIVADEAFGLATAEDYVFTVDGSGEDVTFTTYSPTGERISHSPYGKWSKEYVWSEAIQRMYFFRDGLSPNDLLATDVGGKYGTGGADESPLHTSDGFVHPIRVALDGSIVVLGSGVIHDPKTLDRWTNRLANSFEDAVWLGSELFTMRSLGALIQIQKWTAAAGTTEWLDSVVFAGTTAISLREIDNRLVAVWLDLSGVPRFTFLESDLTIGGVPVANSPPTSVVLTNVTTHRREDASISVDSPLAKISVVDDGNGAHRFSLSGPDADLLEIVNSNLQLKSNMHLDFETKPTYSVTVNVDDLTVGDSPDASTSYTLFIDDGNDTPTGLSLANVVSAIQADVPTWPRLKLADIIVDDDGLGTKYFSVTGPDWLNFEISDNVLWLKAGTILNFEAKSIYHIAVNVFEAGVSFATPFVLSVVSAWHNLQIPNDVNSDGLVRPLDVLLVVNFINRYGQMSLQGTSHDTPYRFDTNNDYSITTLDVLRIVNELNATTAANQSSVLPDLPSAATATEPVGDLYDDVAWALAIDHSIAQGIDSQGNLAGGTAKRAR